MHGFNYKQGKRTYRIVDQETGRVLIASKKGRDLLTYRDRYFSPGAKWSWQHEKRPGEWVQTPSNVLGRWRPALTGYKRQLKRG